jgi:hypothetical protein
MLGGAAAAADAQEVEVHRLRNLTITAYNSTLSNKSFPDKRERVDSAGRFIAAIATVLQLVIGRQGVMDCPRHRRPH